MINFSKYPNLQYIDTAHAKRDDNGRFYVFSNCKNLYQINAHADMFNDMKNPTSFELSRLCQNSANLTFLNLEIINKFTPSDNEMTDSFNNCQSLTGSPVCKDSVTSMFFTYHNCISLTGKAACGDNVKSMIQTYRNCYSLTAPVCGPNVTNMYYTYANCRFACPPVSGKNVIDMGSAYEGCFRLTGSPVCGPNVVHMNWTYHNCIGLNGSPVCGNNVTNMSYTYDGCSNLTGNPVCGPNVTKMYYTYNGCSNLTGKPVCGNNVVDIDYAYQGCTNLTGSPVCGPNVNSMIFTYYGCPNLYGKMYMYSDNVSNMFMCFNGRSNSRRLNIYVNKNSTTFKTLLDGLYIITYNQILWDMNSSNNAHYYNTLYNMHMYAVDNVRKY